uniref:MIF4G domain-containing protein n=1 Tax=Elaeophora elaphi TaxID=1147741 RepID=A0A0R3RMH8_9BILA
MTLKRLLSFEKHQMVTEWEIAKKAYSIRGLNWETEPGMMNVCDEIAKEMIEIDLTFDAMCSLGRYEMAGRMLSILKGCVKSRLQKKGRIRTKDAKRDRMHTKDATKKSAESKRDDEEEEGNEESEGEDDDEEEEEEEEEEEDESEESKNEAEESEESDKAMDESGETVYDITLGDDDSSDEIEELKETIVGGVDEKVMDEIRRHIAETLVEMVRAIQFFSAIGQADQNKEDAAGRANYQFYKMLSAMANYY